MFKLKDYISYEIDNSTSLDNQNTVTINIKINH